LLYAVALLGAAIPSGVLAANPFLSAPDAKPVAAKFKGTEWGDEIGEKDLPLSARVVTTRLAAPPWGAIFKINFENIVSHAKDKREIGPVYFIVTNDEIVLLNEEKPEEVIQKLASQPNPPQFDPGDVYGIAEGARKIPNGSTSETTIIVKGNRCTYEWTHNSGHFRTIIWQKGTGLIEYAQGYGARKDGFRLIREGGKTGK
jgi:hypothetical protein